MNETALSIIMWGGPAAMLVLVLVVGGIASAVIMWLKSKE